MLNINKLWCYQQRVQENDKLLLELEISFMWVRMVQELNPEALDPMLKFTNQLKNMCNMLINERPIFMVFIAINLWHLFNLTRVNITSCMNYKKKIFCSISNENSLILIILHYLGINVIHSAFQLF